MKSVFSSLFLQLWTECYIIIGLVDDLQNHKLLGISLLLLIWRNCFTSSPYLLPRKTFPDSLLHIASSKKSFLTSSKKIYFSWSYQHCNHYFTAATIITTPPKCSATLCFQGSGPLNFQIFKSDTYVYCVFQSSPCKEFILLYLFIFTLTLHAYQIAPITLL